MSKTNFTGYEVTSDGRIFSVDSNWRGYGYREMKQTPNADGYPSVRVTLDGKRVRLAVHRMVATVFLGEKPSADHQVRHLDGDKQNNHVSNLAWGTAKDNALDRAEHGRTNNGWWTGMTDRAKHREACLGVNRRVAHV